MPFDLVRSQHCLVCACYRDNRVQVLLVDMPERSFPGDQGAEMRNMAEGTEKKGNCFARCPLFCCVLMSALLLVSLIVAGLSAGLYVELVSPAVDHAVAEVRWTKYPVY